MPVGEAYRLRALKFERLAKRQANEELKASLEELARNCVQLAEAIERYPELAAFHGLERPRRMH